MSNAMLFREKLYYFYLDSFDRLRSNGLMRTDIPIKQYGILAYSIVSLSSFWTQNTSPYYDHNLPHRSLQETIASLMYPFLTAEGVVVFEKIPKEDLLNSQ